MVTIKYSVNDERGDNQEHVISAMIDSGSSINIIKISCVPIGVRSVKQDYNFYELI